MSQALRRTPTRPDPTRRTPAPRTPPPGTPVCPRGRAGAVTLVLAVVLALGGALGAQPPSPAAPSPTPQPAGAPAATPAPATMAGKAWCVPAGAVDTSLRGVHVAPASLDLAK